MSMLKAFAGAGVVAAMLLVSVPASAQQPAPAQPPQEDAWGRVIQRGANQEGIKSAEQQAADQAKESEEEARRSAVHVSVWAALGYMYIEKLGSKPSFSDIRGPEISVGGGVGFGLSRLWAFQARGGLSFVPASAKIFTGSGLGNDRQSATLLIPIAEAAFRVHLGADSPVFLGFGPRVGAIFISGTAKELASNGTGTSTAVNVDESKTAGLVQAIVELGGLVGTNRNIELLAKPAVGFQLKDGPKPAIGLSAGAAYVF
jgi:hypothetical protein